MESPPGPSIANVFLSFYEVKCFEQRPKECKPVFLQTIFWWPFWSIWILVVQTCLFLLIKKKIESCHLSFWKKGKFITTVYRKLTFSVVYTHFESFLPTVYKFGMVFTLAYLYSVLVGQCFTKNLFSWSKFFIKKQVPFVNYW